MKGEPLSWTIDNDEDLTTVTFTGVLDERCDLDPLHNLSGKVTFDLAGVARINSVGVTQWVKFVEGLEDVTKLFFVRCSVPMVTQLNMIRSFGGNCTVDSFYAPYVCTATGEEQDVLLTSAALVNPLTPPTYPSNAGGELVLGDLPGRYFSFLEHIGQHEESAETSTEKSTEKSSEQP